MLGDKSIMSLTNPFSQVKVAILKYIESLARQMDPTDFVNSSETRLAVSRIITWTTEPKSSDVRKVSQDEEVSAIIIVFQPIKMKGEKKGQKGSEKIKLIVTLKNGFYIPSCPNKSASSEATCFSSISLYIYFFSSSRHLAVWLQLQLPYIKKSLFENVLFLEHSGNLSRLFFI